MTSQNICLPQKQLRVGFPCVIDGKVGLISPRPGTGDVHPKNWIDYKEPKWDFFPIEMPRVEGWW